MNIHYISDINTDLLTYYTRLNEPQLAHINEPDLGFFIAESPNVILRAFNNGYVPYSIFSQEEYLTDVIPLIVDKYPDIPIYIGPIEQLIKITGYNLTKGIACCFYRKHLMDDYQLYKDAKRIVIMQNINNPTNIGAIFRNAAGLNIDAAFLTSDCCDPLYRRSSRVSMGTVFQMNWTYLKDSWLTDLKKAGYKLVGFALNDDYTTITDSQMNSEEKLAIIMGSEGYGLPEETLQQCDYLVCIEMSNNVDSLNVAAASAIAFYQLSYLNKK